MTAIEPDVARWNHGAPPDPATLMHVIAECWPFAADTQGIWLLCREYPLTTDPLAGDADGFDDIKLELIRNQMADWTILHGTSCRPERGAGIWTFVAVIDCDGPVRSRWPDALPMSTKVAAHVGKPPTHGAADPPVVRHWDVACHALKHLAFLLSPWGDAETAAQLDDNWRRHLAAWTPTLYQMYDRTHVPESA
jgi:hypothetical protein